MSRETLAKAATWAGKGEAMYVNNVILVGNLTSDPQLVENDNKVVNFRLAVNRWRKPPSESEGEEVKERTEFIDVECWGGQAENVNRSLQRGDRAIVAGQLKYERWNDAEGAPRSKVRIKAHAIGPSLEFQAIDR
ncbi:MAG: single-stranded DNA-binding protein [Actinobacteria bacterium]|nr:single-stranded DNA-binding protein [Actinomycetota bacterium]